jgi:hypothetical protein
MCFFLFFFTQSVFWFRPSSTIQPSHKQKIVKNRMNALRALPFFIQSKHIRLFGTMKLKYTALAAALANTSAWIHQPLPRLVNSIGRIQSGNSNLSIRQIRGISTQLKSTIVPEEIGTATPLVPDGKPIAEGSVVSIFKGGFFAIRIEDDFTEVDDSPEILDTTKSLPQPTKSSSSLGKKDLLFNIVEFYTMPSSFF